MWEEMLINEAGLPLKRESSFADGCEDASEELVDTDCVALCPPIGPWEVVGAEFVLESCRR